MLDEHTSTLHRASVEVCSSMLDEHTSTLHRACSSNRRMPPVEGWAVGMLMQLAHRASVEVCSTSILRHYIALVSKHRASVEVCSTSKLRHYIALVSKYTKYAAIRKSQHKSGNLISKIKINGKRPEMA